MACHIITAPRRRFSKWRAIYDGARERERRRREGTHTLAWNNDIFRNFEQLEAAEFRDSDAMYWELYASEAELSDQKLVQTLTGDTKSMVILVSNDASALQTAPAKPTAQNSIFSSIVASFIIQTSQALQPNNSQETVCLLSQLLSPGDPTQPSSPFCPDHYPAAPSEATILSNILLFISFFLSMMSVLACALIQQWCREYMTCAHYRGVPSKRGRVRTYLFQGFHQFHMRGFVKGVHVILHVSVFLFFCGVSVYLHGVYPRVGTIAWYCTFVLAVVYITFSIFPLIVRNCPFHTALTSPLRLCRTLLFRTILRFGRSAFLWRGQPENRALPRHHFYKMDSLEAVANARAAQLDTYAMRWLFLDNDIGDTDMDKFLQGLPGYIGSHAMENEEPQAVLTAPFILRRIMEHLLTCATATDLSEQARVKRLLACVESLRAILRQRASAGRPINPDEEESIRMNMQSIVDRLNTACEKPDEIWDLRAFCVRALTFHEFLTRFLEPLRLSSPNDNIPGHFIPLYTFFSSVNMSQTQQWDSILPVEDTAHLGQDNRWQLLLNDGPLINLTLLARAILLNDDADPSSLSMCWKTLDKLRSEFRITRTDVSSSSLTLFNEIHEITRRRVEDDEPGFSVVPLLEILDAVAGGRRLSIVFRDYPEPKYHCKVELVFGKDHLRNPDLFRAFAGFFPDFVTNHSEKSMAFTEGLVFLDDLWTSLRVNLRNYFSPDSSTPEKLRTFDACCVVINAAFIALENSRKVDWRESNFWELTQYFDFVVVDYSRNMSVESGTDFRISLVKARLCRAVLAQFLDQFKREGTVVFHSLEDVASLARVFYSLGVVSDTDVEFWRSFVDGGLASSVLMDKTRTMLRKAERDGPLLNFCKLGQLGLMAVGFRGSGLKDADFEELLGLMQKMTEDSRLPLTHASTPVWEEFNRLRDKVNCTLSHNEDNANMQALLAMIDEVHRRHQERRLSDHVLAQASGTSSVAQPNPPSRGSIPRNDRGCTPTPTAFIEDPLRVNIPSPQHIDVRGMAFCDGIPVR
jgi:hypothetical protein